MLWYLGQHLGGARRGTGVSTERAGMDGTDSPKLLCRHLMRESVRQIRDTTRRERIRRNI